MPKWSQLTRTQQQTARKLRTKLSDAGIDTTVSQIGIYLDDAERWNGGALTDAELCARTGWDLPAAPEATVQPNEAEPQILRAIKARAGRIAALAASLRDERSALRDDITTADKTGIGVNEIARAADGGLSRPKVFEHLGQTDIIGRTREALRAGGITDNLYAVSLTTQSGDVLITIDGPYDGPGTRRDRDLYAFDAALKARGIVLGYRDGGALPPIEWMAANPDVKMALYKS